MAFFRNPHKFAVQGIPPGGLGEYDDPGAARQAGLVPASDAEWQQAESKAAAKAEAETIGGQVATAAEGAVAGALMPLDAVKGIGTALGVGERLEGFGAREAISSAVGAGQAFVDGRDAQLAAAAHAQAQRTRAEANPITAGVSELGGSLVGLGAIGKGLGAVESAAARAAGKTAGVVARGAVEGGIFNVAAEQNRAFLENRELAGEAAWAAMGWGAVLGGLVSGATTKVGDALVNRAARKATRAGVTDAEIRAVGQRTIGEEAVPGFEAAFREAAAGKSAALTDRQALRAIAKSSDQEIESVARPVLGGELPAQGFATEAREILQGKSATLARETYLDGATKELTERLDRVAKIANDVSDEVWVTENKAGHVASNFTKGVAADAKERTLRLTEEVLADLEDVVANAPQFSGKRSVAGLRDSLSDHLKAIEGAATAEKAYMVGDQVRREILNVFSSLESAAKTDAAKANPFTHGVLAETSRRIGQHYNRSFNFLMDEAVWGAQGTAQRGINEAAAEYIQAKKFAFPLFTKQTGKEYLEEAVKFRPVYEVDSAKIAGLARRLGEAGNATTEQQFVRALDTAENFAAQIRKGTVLTNEGSAKVAALESAVKEAKASLSSTATKRRAIDQAEEFAKHVQAERGLAREQAQAAMGQASQDTLVGGIPGIGPAISGAVNLATNPAKQLAFRLKFEQAANRTREAVGFGLDDLFKFVTKKAKEKGVTAPNVSRVTSGAALKLLQGASSSPEKAYSAKREQILAASSGMAGAVRDVGVRYGAHDDPAAQIGFVGAGTRAVNALAAALPGNAMNPASYTPLTSNRPPARAEILHFAQLYQAATKPLDIVRSLATGTVTQEQINVVKEVYPALYDHVRSQVLFRLADADRRRVEVPIREARILDTLLDTDHGSTEFAARYGALMSDNAEAQRQPARPKPGPTKLGQSTATMTNTFLGGAAA